LVSEFASHGSGDERDTLLDMYMRAMETAGPELAAKAA
jgi:hypothetical protein